ncbi:MAG: flagellar protein FliS [Octadecabacter sp.]|nr:flagellar protein FliS [Octadecabacter sp.]
MPLLNPKDIYQRQQKNPNFDTEDRHELIKATLEYLKRSLSILMEKPERHSPIFMTHTARALTSIYVLQSSLNFEKSVKLSTNLFQLYEYTRQQTLKLMRGDETARIDQAHTAIFEILDAWQQIK